jgi:hypothetical protein
VSPTVMMQLLSKFDAELSFPVWTQLATDLNDLSALIGTHASFPVYQVLARLIIFRCFLRQHAAREFPVRTGLLSACCCSG